MNSTTDVPAPRENMIQLPGGAIDAGEIAGAFWVWESRYKGGHYRQTSKDVWPTVYQETRHTLKVLTKRGDILRFSNHLLHGFVGMDWEGGRKDPQVMDGQKAAQALAPIVGEHILEQADRGGGTQHIRHGDPGPQHHPDWREE